MQEIIIIAISVAVVIGGSICGCKMEQAPEKKGKEHIENE